MRGWPQSHTNDCASQRCLALRGGAYTLTQFCARDRLLLPLAIYLPRPSEMVEIVIGDLVIPVGSDVEPERLAAVIRAVRQA